MPGLCVSRFLQCEDHELASRDVVVRHELVLRQWTDINTSHEFRCFVQHGKLRGQSSLASRCAVRDNFNCL